jgi:general secretion pathway protein G
MAATRRQHGFTLIELMVVLSIMLILLSFAVPMYKQSILKARETCLKADLLELRHLIEEYTYDKKKAPQSLDELVQAGYLRRLPQDPITSKSDWDSAKEVDPVSEGVEIGISDIHSCDRRISTEGTAYSSW